MVTKTKSKFWGNLKSSNIESIEYRPIPEATEDTGNVTVTFKSGMAYCYFRVPFSVVETIINSESIGKAFNQLIKNGGYEFNRII